jgi:hypothetical protein
MIKLKIPKALKEQLWLKHYGKSYSGKCLTKWCKNEITVFDFQAGHDVPESKGGETIIENLVPICARCNLSMSNTYTFKEWNELSKPAEKRKMIDWLKSFAFKGNGFVSPNGIMNQNANPTTLPGRPSKIQRTNKNRIEPGI